MVERNPETMSEEDPCPPPTAPTPETRPTLFTNTLPPVCGKHVWSPVDHVSAAIVTSEAALLPDSVNAPLFTVLLAVGHLGQYLVQTSSKHLLRFPVQTLTVGVSSTVKMGISFQLTC